MKIMMKLLDIYQSWISYIQNNPKYKFNYKGNTDLTFYGKISNRLLNISK